MANRSIFLIALLALSCAAPTSPKPADQVRPAQLSAPAEEHVEFDGALRLDDDVRPLSYDVELSLDPSADTFSGKVAIQISLKNTERVIKLHAQDLEFDENYALLRGVRADARLIKCENGGITLYFEAPLSPGRATLHFSFKGKLNANPDGLFRLKDGDSYYLYSYFDPISARRAFPCFDQPSFKTPYSITLRIPHGLTGLTNTPELRRETSNGDEVIHFKETEPLPTYLVAFAVGTFDLFEIDQAQTSTPVRFVTPQGKIQLSRYATDQVPRILSALEDYFGIPYPSAKLDFVVLPAAGFGAMEQTGLITVDEKWILFREEDAPLEKRSLALEILAHEISHMWIGNLVTPFWWDDIWLNEAFATWMPTVVLHPLYPEYNFDIQAGQNARRIMEVDAQSKTRAVRQPVTSSADIANAFDSIIYYKGQAIVRMLEAWLTPPVLRQGLRTVMERFARGNYTTPELLDVLTRLSGKPVTAVMDRFINQPGTPFIDVRLTCADSIAISLKQSRYLRAQSHAEQGEAWTIPFCIKYFAKRKTQQECFLLDDEQKTFNLGAAACPEWIYPNAGEYGYFRWRLPEHYLISLVTRFRDELALIERVALPAQLTALLQAGSLSIDVYLDALEVLAKDQEPQQIFEIIAALRVINQLPSSTKQKKAFAGYVKRLLAPHLKRIGAKSRADDTDGEQQLRTSLIEALAGMGNDQKLRKADLGTVKKWLADPQSVELAEVIPSVTIAAWDGDEKLWLALQELTQTTNTPLLRASLNRALGQFTDDALLVKSLDLLLTSPEMAQQFVDIATRPHHDSTIYERRWAWLQKNYDQLAKMVSDVMRTHLPRIAEGCCTENTRREIEDFFSIPPRAQGGEHKRAAQVLETIDQCVWLRKTMSSQLENHLAP